MEHIVYSRNDILPVMKMEPDDDLVICRCEEITKGEIRKAVHNGLRTMNEIKRFLRPGMGPCQGLSCTPLVKQIIARELHVSANDLDECTARPPVRAIEAWIYGDERE